MKIQISIRIPYREWEYQYNYDIIATDSDGNETRRQHQRGRKILKGQPLPDFE
jgi:hypothetical protein